jgi:hypothetical protein
MNTLLFLFILFILSSNTYISYITFLLCMINIVLGIFLLGNSYLSLIYFIIYVGSIAILFIYILMVLSIISSYRYGYLLFIFPFITLSLLGISINNNSFILSTIHNYSYSIYTSLLIPIGVIIFVALIFAIRSI